MSDNIDPILKALSGAASYSDQGNENDMDASDIHSTICVRPLRNSSILSSTITTSSAAGDRDDNQSLYQPSRSHLSILAECREGGPPTAAETSVTAESSKTGSIPRKRMRETTSWTWGEDNVIHGTKCLVNGEYLWQCNHCVNKTKPRQYLLNSGSTPRAQHLNKVHGIYEKEDKKRKKVEARERTIQDAMKRAADVGLKRQKIANAEQQDKELIGTLNSEVIADLLFMPNSISTVQSWVVRTFNTQRSVVCDALQRAQSEIHITIDGWTSPNHLPIIGIIGHYTEEDGSLHQSVLAIRNIEGSHSGENMSQIVINVLEFYGITSKMGYTMMDNASANDTLLYHLGKHLIGSGLEWDSVQRRLRCIGHIINLSVKDFLFTGNVDLTRNNESLYETTRLECWRRIGPLGRAHNIIIHIRHSPQRIADFKGRSGGLLPHRDNDTRWNSWYELLTTILRPAVHKAIDLYAYDYNLDDDRLSKQDWDVLDRIRAFLQPFEKVTLATEGRTSTLGKVLPAMDFLIAHYDKAIIEFSGDAIFNLMLQAGRAKMWKYCSFARSSVPYIAAVVLNPTMKWRYCEDRWSPSEVLQARTILNNYWATTYKPTGPATSIINPDLDRVRDDLDSWMYSSAEVSRSQMDELERYCGTPPEMGAADSREWWMEVNVRQHYPTLSKMAIDIHSIPAMSAEPERLFSAAKHTISTLRGRLGVETIEALECLKSWDRTRD